MKKFIITVSVFFNFMKKYLIAFIIAFIIMICCLAVKLDNFLIGWFSCMGWYISLEIYKKWNDHEKN